MGVPYSQNNSMPVFNRRDNENHDPHLWSFPTSFRNLSLKKHGVTQIPHQAIFRDAVDAGPSSSSRLRDVTPGHIAVHLCLLECAHKLKQRSAQLLPTAPQEECDDCSWNTLLRLSIDRFEVWYSKIGEILRRSAFYHKTGPGENDATFTKDYLPPLDVLYIWTIYLSNPSLSPQGRQDLSFPWEAILKCMNTTELTYTIPSAAQKLFRTITGQDADILEYLKSPPAYFENEDDKATMGLLEAAHSHNAFLEAMHTCLWIRSPALEGTLYRGLAQYKQTEALARQTRARILQDEPLLRLVAVTNEISSPSPPYSSDVKPPVDVLDDVSEDIFHDCHCWICERVRDEDPAYVHGTGQLTLTKDQVQEIKDDVGFHRHVEQFRQRNPPGTQLPTRPLTRRELEEQNIEQRKKDRAGVYYGLGYVVKEKRPAMFDEAGNMIKPAKLEVKRASAVQGINWMMFGP